MRNWTGFLAGIIGVGCAFALAAWSWSSLVERSIIRDADRRSIEWTQYAASRLHRLDIIGAGGAPTDEEWDIISDISTFGDVFRFKVFSPGGTLRFVSDDPTASGSDLGQHNAAAAAVVESGRPLTVVADGTSKPDRPDLYSETYLPIVQDGSVAAILEVYFDQTKTAAAVRADYATFGSILALLFALVAAVPLGWIAVLVRRLRRQNAELDVERRAALAGDRAKSEFLSTVSHELRTPMNGIIGVVQLLDGADFPDEDRELLDILRSCSEAQMALIEDILTFGEVEAGAVRIVEEPASIADLIKAATGFAIIAAQTKGIDLRKDVPVDVPDMMVDGKRVRQIMANLVGNAVKFTQAGSVDIEVEFDPVAAGDMDGTLAIDVRDTGPGIAKEHHALIFRRFTQGDGSLSRKAGGTGLGLAIAQSLAEQMGGDITMQSVLGEGSTFTFTLPVRLAEAEPDVDRHEKEAA